MLRDSAEHGGSFGSGEFASVEQSPPHTQAILRVSGGIFVDDHVVAPAADAGCGGVVCGQQEPLYGGGAFVESSELLRASHALESLSGGSDRVAVPAADAGSGCRVCGQVESPSSGRAFVEASEQLGASHTQESPSLTSGDSDSSADDRASSANSQEASAQLPQRQQAADQVRRALGREQLLRSLPSTFRTSGSNENAVDALPLPLQLPPPLPLAPLVLLPSPTPPDSPQKALGSGRTRSAYPQAPPSPAILTEGRKTRSLSLSIDLSPQNKEFALNEALNQCKRELEGFIEMATSPRTLEALASEEFKTLLPYAERLMVYTMEDIKSGKLKATITEMQKLHKQLTKAAKPTTNLTRLLLTVSRITRLIEYMDGFPSADKQDDDDDDEGTSPEFTVNDVPRARKRNNTMPSRHVRDVNEALSAMMRDHATSQPPPPPPPTAKANSPLLEANAPLFAERLSTEEDACLGSREAPEPNVVTYFFEKLKQFCKTTAQRVATPKPLPSPKQGVAEPSQQSPVVKGSVADNDTNEEPVMVMCRICETKIRSDEIEQHSEVCAQENALLMKISVCDKRLHKLGKNISSVVEPSAPQQAQQTQRSSPRTGGSPRMGGSPRPFAVAHTSAIPIKSPTSHSSRMGIQQPIPVLCTTGHGTTAAVAPKISAEAKNRLLSLRGIVSSASNISFTSPTAVQVLQKLVQEVATLQDEAQKPEVLTLLPFTMRATQHMKTKLDLINQILQLPLPSPQMRTLAKTSISKHDFEIIKPISRGAFGEVFLARKKQTQDLYAIKVIKKSQVLLKNQLAHIKAERNILALTHNNFLVSLYYCFQTREFLFLVMEFVSGGDCYSLLKELGFFSPEMTQFYIAHVVCALHYLHSMGVVHRDIKPDNLLITATGHLKLTDFGLSRYGMLNNEYLVCTVHFLACSNITLVELDILHGPTRKEV
eukprot:TRINITY_DN949_c0_g2_i6.p1 TRINITY_DN949_c0_g2~~TRINITY_DN949_c0_g2_i6.p1  ORF type:complete len:940 (+),score=212.30 TRINITY_DN949_c0_g2_i6:415-3234(+)